MTPRSSPWKSLTLVGYSSLLLEIIWSQAIYILVAISLTTISQTPIRLPLSVVALRFGWSKIGRLWIYLSAAKLSCLKISQTNWFEMWNKYIILRWLQIKHNKNNVFIVDQSTIAANEPKQVYLAIKSIRTILITHCSYIHCRILRRNILAPSYRSSH